MVLYTLVLLALAVFGLADAVSVSSTDTDTPSCTLTFTATQPPQIGPTTTIYQAIMTTFLYAVDCDICTVTNTPSALIQGPFEVRSTSSMLTITQVECIPTGRASTRLHEFAHGNMAAAATQTPAWNNMKGFTSSDLFRRSDQATEASLANLAMDFASALPPDVALLSGGLRDEFTNIASAMFALSVCDSGLNLTAACAGLGTAQTKLELLQSWYNPDNIQSIVCFCSMYGYDFGTTRQQLYANLYAALIGVLAAADVTTERGQICDTLGLFNRTGGSLGIDTQLYHELVCSNIPSATPTTPIWYGPTPIIPYVTNNMTTWGTPTSWAPNMTITGTGIPTSWAPNMTVLPGTGTPEWNGTGNGSTWGPPLSFTGTIGSDWSLTINTQTNWTDSQPTGTGPASETGAAASNDSLIAARTPRGRNAMPFYPAVSTPTQRPSLFKRY
ncbi:hypothetical protein CLCR_00178 [Cladophialophora carrionii]|uniref:Uncharacterized protein n=1 Tax=Cladophialophora carrionii TaxID=86049 RepID=A0A1C1D065_9EURO|nr:hypothetical protein CLCR_00178 [Cladophialophora carrionii]